MREELSSLKHELVDTCYSYFFICKGVGLLPLHLVVFEPNKLPKVLYDGQLVKEEEDPSYEKPGTSPNKGAYIESKGDKVEETPKGDDVP